MSSALQCAVLSTTELWPSSNAAAIDVVRSTASSTENCRAGAVIGRCAATDVVRSRVRSTEYNTAVADIGRRAEIYVVRSSVSNVYCREVTFNDRGGIDVVRSTARKQSSVAMLQRNYVRICKFYTRYLV